MNTWSNLEGTFPTSDGVSLFYRGWKAAVESRKALIFLHRGHEHSGRIARQVESLGLADFWAFSWDARGHGRSPGERGYAPDFGALVRDLDTFVRFVSREYNIPVENMAIVANSVGAVIAAAWVHDYAPRVRSMVLVAPAFRIKLYVPLAIPLLRVLMRIKPKSFIKSYVKSRMLTSDPEEARRYDEDPLITRNIAVNILLGLHDMASRIVADAAAIRTPTLVFSAGKDYVVEGGIQRRFFDRLSSGDKEMHVLAGFRHAVFYERRREEAFELARRFILASFAKPEGDDSLLTADQSGYTRREYDMLLAPAPPLRALGFAAVRLGMKTVGRLSRGVALGLRTGFDSGETLDYVYENRARGRTPVGRWIDRAYLDNLGWKGIRQRKLNLEKCLARAIENVATAGGPVGIMDIASGPGRYLLETVKAMPDREIHLLLRDYAAGSVETGRRLAAELGVHTATFQQGDAFDEAALSQMAPAPDIVVVSGLYELFPDNAKVLVSLRGVVKAVRPGGFLIYTGQPWHPQLEMIARTLPNREGRPWVMRRRTQAELDALVESVGFRKEKMEIDRWGIFTVSVARKPA